MNIGRRDSIRRHIQERGDVQLRELEQMFPDVSSMTIRRDLAHLESQGIIIRTRGGAKSAGRIAGGGEDVYNLRAMENVDAKVKIAKKAVEFIETGRSIFIDSGTTTMCLAKILPDENFSIMTSGPNIGVEILRSNKPSVTLVGGLLSRNNLSTSGASALDYLKTINIDIAFMATSGFSLRSGFTIGNFDECELKKLVIKKARKTILLMDSSKVDKNLPFTFAALKDIDMLITDTLLPEAILKAAEKGGVQVY